MASTPTSRILTSRSYCEALRRHYVNCWGSEPEPLVFQEGSADELPSEFRVLRFAPNERRKMWTYSTVCMSQRHDAMPMELHLFAPRQNDEVVELLVVTSHYHRTGEWLGLGHTVNFGRPDRKSTRLNSSHITISYAVFCLKKKTKKTNKGHFDPAAERLPQRTPSHSRSDRVSTEQ